MFLVDFLWSISVRCQSGCVLAHVKGSCPSGVLYTRLNQDINICNINPPSHTCEVVAHKQFMLLPASIWTTIHPCPYKQTRPSLAAGHRLGNCRLGRSCALVWKCSIVRVLQGPRILQHFTMWPIQPWFEF